ncbi:hypothetical protein, partial [Alistipes communis]|uniref:hypothetical protein n=1 Tax=Alistipes communis TaxID=2585118 RepID=UPI00248AB71C
FHSSFSRLGRVRTAFGSALGLTKTLNFILRFLASVESELRSVLHSAYRKRSVWPANYKIDSKTAVNLPE